MLRATLGLVSLLIMAVVAVLYFTTTEPEVAQTGQYQKIEQQANAAAAHMARDPQVEVDAATSPTTTTTADAPATTPPPTPAAAATNASPSDVAPAGN